MRFLFAAILMSVSCLGACDVPVKSQVPSHVAEFAMPTSDYPKLLALLDSMAASFGLKRVDAAPGLRELHGREVLFAAYEPKDPKEWRGALEVSDIHGPGKILLRLYGDYFNAAEERARFVAELSDIVRQFGGTLTSKQPARAEGQVSPLGSEGVRSLLSPPPPHP